MTPEERQRKREMDSERRRQKDLAKYHKSVARKSGIEKWKTRFKSSKYGLISGGKKIKESASYGIKRKHLPCPYCGSYDTQLDRGTGNYLCYNCRAVFNKEQSKEPKKEMKRRIAQAEQKGGQS